jgi:hypothetical protein
VVDAGTGLPPDLIAWTEQRVYTVVHEEDDTINPIVSAPRNPPVQD